MCQKYNLIKEIKKHYNIEKFFASPVAKYKHYASAYRLFESLSDREINDPKTIMQCRITLVENITTKRARKNKARQEIIENFSSQDEDTRLLAYKILVDKFNNKYKGLSLDQKNLLEQYINNVSNKKTLAEFVNKKANVLHKGLVAERKKVEDKIVSIKLNKIASKLSILKNFGIKGIRFNTNKIKGKSAMKKLKEIDPALEVNVPLVKPIKYNSKRSKNENPFNPGIFI